MSENPKPLENQQEQIDGRHGRIDAFVGPSREFSLDHPAYGNFGYIGVRVGATNFWLEGLSADALETFGDLCKDMAVELREFQQKYPAQQRAANQERMRDESGEELMERMEREEDQADARAETETPDVAGDEPRQAVASKPKAPSGKGGAGKRRPPGR